MTILEAEELHVPRVLASGISVVVSTCPPHDNLWLLDDVQVAHWQGDLARVFGASLLRRFAVAERRPNITADLRYVPSVCFQHYNQQQWDRYTPKLGIFTVEGDSNTLPQRLCCYLGMRATSCMHHYLSTALIVLGVEAQLEFMPHLFGSMPIVGWRYRPLLPTHGEPNAPVAAFMVPYPSGITIEHRKGLRPVPALEDRAYLAALVANSKGLFNRGAMELREWLHNECRAAPDCVSPRDAAKHRSKADRPKIMAEEMLPGGGGISHTRLNAGLPADGVEDGANSMGTVASAYANAVFCLQPFGDTFTRKGYYDAILLGCIPVVFSRTGWDQLERYGWYGDQSELAVEVPLQYVQPGGRGALSYLRAMSDERRRWHHANVMRERLYYQYSMHSRGGLDATEVALRGVAHELRGWHSSRCQPWPNCSSWDATRLCPYPLVSELWGNRPPWSALPGPHD